MEFVWFMKGQFAAFQCELIFICGTEHLSLIYIYHFPKIMTLTVIVKVFGELHIKKSNYLFNPKNGRKAISYKIVCHKITRLSDFISIVTDFALQFKDEKYIMSL